MSVNYIPYSIHFEHSLIVFQLSNVITRLTQELEVISTRIYSLDLEKVRNHTGQKTGPESNGIASI